MLSFFYRLSRPLRRARSLIWAVLVLALGMFAVGIVRSGDSAGLPLASLVLALWAGLLIALSHCFVTPPLEPAPRAAWHRRLAYRLKLALLWMLALASLGALGLVAMLSSRAIGLLLD